MPIVTDPEFAALAVLIGTIVGVIGTWSVARQAEKHKSDEALNARVDRRIEIILEEREARISELKAEVHQLGLTITSLREVLQTVFLAGVKCKGAIEGNCPLSHEDLSNRLANAITLHPKEG